MPIITTEKQKEKLAEFLAEEIATIRGLQREKGLYASGKSQKSLRQSVEEMLGGEIIRGTLIDGSGSFEYQERGRGPGSGKQTSWFLYEKIFYWLQYKKYGLDWTDYKSRRKLAWAIAIKINKLGTYTHRTTQRTGVLSEALPKERLDKLKSVILNTENVIEIKNELLKEIKWQSR